jgi:hypothetical protein
MTEKMEEPRRECMECGQDHWECDQNLLMGMFLAASDQARRQLSPEGQEACNMLIYASDVIGAIDAYESMEAIEDLSDEDVRAIEIFVARLTLIEAAQSWERYAP